MKKMLNRKLLLTLKQPVDHLELPGATLIVKKGLTYEFIVTGDFEILTRHLAELPVSDIVLPEPDLQEIFMNYYLGKKDE